MRQSLRVHIKNWYAVSSDNIAKLYGNDARLFANILAATSPRKHVKANWHLAVKVYDCIKAGKSIDNIPGILPAAYTNILRAVNNLPLSGKKVSAFAANLNGDLNRVTIDVWMERFYPKLKHNQIESRVKRGAKRLKMFPAEYQAIIWTKSRMKAGKGLSSYNSVPDIFQRKFDFVLDKV